MAMLNELKASSVKICSNCMRRFYSVETCQLCTDIKCPNCNKCSCPSLEKSSYEPEKKKNFFTPITLNSIFKSPLKSNLQIEGTLSPLEGQELIKTRNGKLVLSHYILSDNSRKIPFKIWGPLTKNLYENRYNSIRVRITGLKLSRFNGQLQIVLQRNGKIKVLSAKQTNLRTTLEKHLLQ